MQTKKSDLHNGFKAFTSPHGGEISCEDVIRCVLEISKEGWNIYHYIVKEGAIRVDQIAAFLGKDRSTAYRELEKLINCGICFKERTNLKEGGYFYLYQAKSMDEIRRETRSCIDATYEKLKRATEKSLSRPEKERDGKDEVIE